MSGMNEYADDDDDIVDQQFWPQDVWRERHRANFWVKVPSDSGDEAGSKGRRRRNPWRWTKVVSTTWLDCLKIFAPEYRKLDVGPSDTSSVDGSEEQILYKGKDCVQEGVQLVTITNYKMYTFPELIQMLQAPPAEG